MCHEDGEYLFMCHILEDMAGIDITWEEYEEGLKYLQDNLPIEVVIENTEEIRTNGRDGIAWYDGFELDKRVAFIDEHLEILK